MRNNESNHCGLSSGMVRVLYINEDFIFALLTFLAAGEVFGQQLSLILADLLL